MSKAFPKIDLVLDSVDAVLRKAKSLDEALQLTAELLAEQVTYYDWVGFYLVDESGVNLRLGPYVGAATEHTKISFGKGVCGQVAVSETSRVIQDVSLEENYLSCGIDVQSEIVFPIMKQGKFVAELDIDSHAIAPFTENDNKLLEAVCSKLEALF